MEVDVTRVARLRPGRRRTFAQREGVNLSFLPFFVKAAIEALKEHPASTRRSTRTKEITYHGSVNLAIAVDTPRGLIVPVIKNADDLNLAGLAQRIADLAERTRNNKIGPDELPAARSRSPTPAARRAVRHADHRAAAVGDPRHRAVVKRPVVVKDADGDE